MNPEIINLDGHLSNLRLGTYFAIMTILWSIIALGMRLLFRTYPIHDKRHRFFRRALHNHWPEALAVGTIAAALTTGLYAAMHEKSVYEQIRPAAEAYTNREHPGASIIHTNIATFLPGSAGRVIELDRNNDGAVDCVVDIAIDYVRDSEQSTATFTPRPECG